MTAARRGVAGAGDLVWVEGPDASGFLQGLLTNDVDHLQVGGGHHTLLLDDTGHVQADLRLHRSGDQDFTLLTEVGLGATLVERLEAYHFSEDLLVLGPESTALVTTLDGPPPPIDGPVDLVVPGLVPGTWDAVGTDAAAIARALDVTLTGAEELECRRVATLTPRFGIDYGPEHLVHEARLEHRAVSFAKGCYLGQETVARVEYRGRVNRRLVALALHEPVDCGAEVTFAGRSVGTLTTVTRDADQRWIGLGIVRRETGEGETVNVGPSGVDATIVPSPFTEGSQSSP